MKFNKITERGVFTWAPKSEAKAYHIHGSFLVDVIQSKGKGNSFEKWHLVVQAYSDNDEGILKCEKTVQRLSKRSDLALRALRNRLQLLTCDFSQDYVQSENCTKRPILVCHSKTVDVPGITILQDNLLLYGISEIGLIEIAYTLTTTKHTFAFSLGSISLLLKYLGKYAWISTGERCYARSLWFTDWWYHQHKKQHLHSARGRNGKAVWLQA